MAMGLGYGCKVLGVGLMREHFLEVLGSTLLGSWLSRRLSQDNKNKNRRETHA